MLEHSPSWFPGCRFDSTNGAQMDAGGYIFRTIMQNNLSWYNLTRTNKRDLHPLWFGVYGNCIYHHGAGFRKPISRLDISKFGSSKSFEKRIELSDMLKHSNRIFDEINTNCNFINQFI